MWHKIFHIMLVFFLIDSYVHNFSAPVIQQFQRFCQSRAPIDSKYKEVYQALVCGSSPKPTPFIQDIKQIGLYHLLVVSGSHLVFLESVLVYIFSGWGRWGQIIIFANLLMFTFVSGMQPPIFRALINFMLHKLSDETKLYWRPHQSTFFAGLVTLLIKPDWLLSISFMLSWAASLLVSSTSQKGLYKHLVIFLGLSPLLYSMQEQSPITCFSNFLFSLILGAIFFPLSLITLVFNQLAPIVDLFWGAIEVVIHQIANELQSASAEPRDFTYFWLWVYLFALQYFFHKKSHNHLKARAFDSNKI